MCVRAAAFHISPVVGQTVHVPAFHPVSQWAFLTEQACETRRLHAQSSDAELLVIVISVQLKLLLALSAMHELM